MPFPTGQGHGAFVLTSNEQAPLCPSYYRRTILGDFIEQASPSTSRVGLEPDQCLECLGTFLPWVSCRLGESIRFQSDLSPKPDENLQQISGQTIFESSAIGSGIPRVSWKRGQDGDRGRLSLQGLRTRGAGAPCSTRVAKADLGNGPHSSDCAELSLATCEQPFGIGDILSRSSQRGRRGGK